MPSIIICVTYNLLISKKKNNNNVSYCSEDINTKMNSCITRHENKNKGETTLAALTVHKHCLFMKTISFYLTKRNS